jgi:hypothetical protein
MPFWNVTEDFTLCEIIWTFEKGDGGEKRGGDLPYTEVDPHTRHKAFVVCFVLEHPTKPSAQQQKTAN